ncbi:hypothetical protein [Polyangium sp. y55x31]|uniref:hypothetical protein n=1 Tax=Polyangium sp. y55x31 TaxID=3042688 RepID=UPI002482A117|nr:hypothetical protein [Polyangium sp. y55x31]MDI1475777.1 hypothetical protein [Polyangium sp. y55x31]
MTRRSVKMGIVAIALAVMGALGASCARSDRAATQPAANEPGAAPVVDSVLLAFLSKARAAHHKADLAEASGDVAGAIAALESLTNGARPGGATPLPEASEVLSDTYARLADLRSAKSEFDAALGDVDAGLLLAKETTYFRGHLFEVRGLVEERRAKSMPEGEGRERARKAAMDAFDEAVRIQDQVISSALGDAGPR